MQSELQVAICGLEFTEALHIQNFKLNETCIARARLLVVVKEQANKTVRKGSHPVLSPLSNRVSERMGSQKACTVRASSVVVKRWTDTCSHVAAFSHYDWWAELAADPTGMCLAFVLARVSSGVGESRLVGRASCRAPCRVLRLGVGVRF